MPLRDHFHLPLRGLCSWESFHSAWAIEMMRQLNKTLPPGYVDLAVPLNLEWSYEATFVALRVAANLL
jgi:hypothetical protein